MKLKQNFIVIIALLILIVIAGFVLLRKGDGAKQITNSNLQQEQPYVVINDYRLNVEIANTPEKKSKGLGGRTHLADNYGMLFLFNNQPYPPVFWMKGMEIPIDIIWIKDNTIIDIDKSAQPESGISDAQLKRYSPDKPVDYVLEVKDGLSDERGFEVEDSVVVQLAGQ